MEKKNEKITIKAKETEEGRSSRGALDGGGKGRHKWWQELLDRKFSTLGHARVEIA